MAVQHLLNLTSDRLRSLPILIFYLTDGCNSRCTMCDIWRSPRRNMAMGLVESVASEMPSLGVRWAVLSGGEAMQHPQWQQVAARLRQSGARVILITNGLLLKRQAADVIAHVDEVVVSLDGGTPATYETIRGVDAFDLVVDGIRAVKRGGIPVTTRTTVQARNFRELPLIVEAAKAAGADHISFLTIDVSNPFAFGNRFNDDIIPVMSPTPSTDALTPDQLAEFETVLDGMERDYAADFVSGRIAESPSKLRKMIPYFHSLFGKSEVPPVRCNAPHTSAVIEVDGSLRPCYFLPAMGRVQPNVSLRQAMNTSEALALRRAYRCGERPECAHCVCPLYKSARALVTM